MNCKVINNLTVVRKNTKKTKQEENKKIQQKIKNRKIQVSN